MKRKLCTRMAAHGGTAKSHKTSLCREHRTRMFNAMAIEVQGLIDGVRERELLTVERKDLAKSIRRPEPQLAGRQGRLEAIAADRLRMNPQREAKLRRTTHQKATRPA